MYAGGAAPDGSVSMKILWQARSHLRTRWLLIDGSRLDGAGTFRQGFRTISGGRFPSTLTVPQPGCWRLDIRVGTGRATPDGEPALRPLEPRTERVLGSIDDIPDWVWIAAAIAVIGALARGLAFAL